VNKDFLKLVFTFYDVSKTTIKDHSVLGDHERKLCQNVDLHWMSKNAMFLRMIRRKFAYLFNSISQK